MAAELERKVGQLTYEIDWFKEYNEILKPKIVNLKSNLSVKRQAELLQINCSMHIASLL